MKKTYIKVLELGTLFASLRNGEKICPAESKIISQRELVELASSSRHLPFLLQVGTLYAGIEKTGSNLVIGAGL